MQFFPGLSSRVSRLAMVIGMVFSPVAAGLAAEQPERSAPDAAQLEPFELGVVQVHATKSDADLLDDIKAEQALTPGGVSVMDGQAFYEQSVNNMADALRYVPGVWSESETGSDAIFLSIRGSNLDATDYDNNGVKLFQDGLPITTADGNNHNRFMDPFAARYVIVARGANALTYGASTLGGAINFLSRTAQNSPPLEAFIQGGSYGLRSGRLSAGRVVGDFDGLITLESKRWDGYREHSRQERTSMYANAGWQFSEDFGLRLFATHIENDQELAGDLTRAQFEADPSQANPSAITGNFQLNVKTDRLAAKGVWTINSDSRLELGLSYESQALYHPIVDKVMVDFDGPGPNPPVEVFSLLIDTDQRTVGGMVRYNLTAGNHNVLAGINLAATAVEGGNYRNDGGRPNGQTEMVDNDSDSTELFLVDRWQFTPDWTLVYGAQGVLAGRDVRVVDVASGNARNPQNDYSSFNPRIGAIYAFSQDNEFFASASRLYEAPTHFELENDVRGGNATLDAMHGTVYEVGLRGASAASVQAPRWHWNVSLFYSQIQDEILSVEDPLAPGTSLSANIGHTIHAGIDALLSASFPFGAGEHQIEPLVSVTYNDFSFADDPVYGNNVLPAAPDYAVRGEVMYRHSSGFFAGPTFDLVGARYADFSNTYRIDGYSLLGLRAGIERDSWNLFGEVKNLLDETYVAAISVRNQADTGAAVLQPGAPRSVYVGVQYQF